MAVRRLFGTAGLLLIGGAMIATSRWNTVQSPDVWRTEFREAALRIPFDTERGPVPDDGVSPGVRPKGMPKMTIATALTRDTGKVGRVEFRITSAGAYPRLGIPRGVSYVWKDFVGGQVRLLVIPADPSYRARWLKVESHQHKPNPKVPRLLIMSLPDSTPSSRGDTLTKEASAVAICTDDCKSSSWCKARDTISKVVATKLEFPSHAIEGFLNRNNIPMRTR
jgi:hypothetical protein